MIETSLTGRCLCGATTYRLDAAPRVHYCHCSFCQRATGAAAAVLAWVPQARLRWTGSARPSEYRSSPIAARGFCGTCGTPLTLRYDAKPEEIALHLGTLDQRSAFPPGYHYGAEGRLPWFDAGEGLPSKDTAERW